jgi:hypothetical protein
MIRSWSKYECMGMHVCILYMPMSLSLSAYYQFPKQRSRITMEGPECLFVRNPYYSLEWVEYYLTFVFQHWMVSVESLLVRKARETNTAEGSFNITNNVLNPREVKHLFEYAKTRSLQMDSQAKVEFERMNSEAIRRTRAPSIAAEKKQHPMASVNHHAQQLSDELDVVSYSQGNAICNKDRVVNTAGDIHSKRAITAEELVLCRLMAAYYAHGLENSLFASYSEAVNILKETAIEQNPSVKLLIRTESFRAMVKNLNCIKNHNTRQWLQSHVQSILGSNSDEPLLELYDNTDNAEDTIDTVDGTVDTNSSPLKMTRLYDVTHVHEECNYSVSNTDNDEDTIDTVDDTLDTNQSPLKRTRLFDVNDDHQESNCSVS